MNLIALASIGALAAISLVVVNFSNLTSMLAAQNAENISVSNISGEKKPECPASCNDSNPCTLNYCDETTNYSCSIMPVNGDADGCNSRFSGCVYNTCVAGKCVVMEEKNCCGNKKCETGEACFNCPQDCECEIEENQSSSTPSQTIQSSQTTESQQQQSATSTITQPTTEANTTQNTQQTALNHVTINEFTTRGSNGTYDEFAELYNPTNADINLTGWKLQYKSATGDTWQSKVGLGLSGIIKANSYYLLASKGYTFNPVPDYKHDANWGFADAGGHVRIIDSTGIVIDKVGYGNANDAEGSPAPALEDGKSLQRRSLTVDTDNNSQDFELISLPTPKNSAG